MLQKGRFSQRSGRTKPIDNVYGRKGKRLVAKSNLAKWLKVILSDHSHLQPLFLNEKLKTPAR